MDEAVFLWQGQARGVLVVEAKGGVLLGAALLHGCRLVVDFIHGDPVKAIRLPGRRRAVQSLALPRSGVPHPSMLRSPFFLAHAIQRADGRCRYPGQTTLWRAAGLPEPEFRRDRGPFVQTLWRDWPAPGVLSRLEINEG